MPYKIFNAPMPTITLTAKQSTGTGVRTMLQIQPATTRNLEVLAWGYTLDAVPAGGGAIELLQTDVAATGLTAHVAANVYNLDPGGLASLLQFGTGATGFATTAQSITEGTPVNTRVFDIDQISGTAAVQSLNQDYQFVLDERPVVAAGKFLRLRVNMAGAVNMSCWATVREIG